MTHVTIDFETRSNTDIKKGAWMYSKHETTEVLCLAYKIGNQETQIVKFKETTEIPDDLYKALFLDEMTVEAHNTMFEKCIWLNILNKKYEWPIIPDEKWDCSAARAAYHGLPRSLDGVVNALKLDVKKDLDGSMLMRKMCKPRKPLKTEEKDKLLWHEEQEQLDRLYEYCIQDVETEYNLSLVLPPLTEKERAIWLVDQKLNMRGIKCDIQLIESAIKIRDKEVFLMNEEISDITRGVVENGKQRASVLNWIKSQNIDIENTQAATIDRVLKTALPIHVESVINLMREICKTSTAKYDTMLNLADPKDHRLRDLMMYHGASTGRWTGKGVQPHNFPRGKVKDTYKACEMVRNGQVQDLKKEFGLDIMSILSSCLRGALIPSEGKELVVADYAAIEARVVLWLANELEALYLFETGGDIYCDTASSIYGYECTKKKNPDERTFGKQAVLGLGYQMGFLKFLITCKKYDIHFTEEQAKGIVKNSELWEELKNKVFKYFKDDEKRYDNLKDNELSIENNLHELILMLYVVNVYRAKYSNVKQMWNIQEELAVKAVQNKGVSFYNEIGKCTWQCEKIANIDCLTVLMPSGKKLFYWEPKLVKAKAPFTNSDGSPVYNWKLTMMGSNSVSRKWERQSTYGGKLVENITQAIARDLMAEAMLRTDSTPYDLLISVHDELVCEIDIGKADIKEFEQLMAKKPDWAHDCPVEAEGWIGPRYRK